MSRDVFPEGYKYEVHITNHCNLNCMYCDHFAPLADEWFISLEEYEKETRRISELMSDSLKIMQVLGGEPLLHPQINELLAMTRKYLPNTMCALITNGTLLDNMPDSFWQTCKETDFYIIITRYPIKLNTKKIMRQAEKFNVNVSFDDNGITNNKIKTYMFSVEIDLNKTRTKEENCNECYYQPRCIDLRDGKIFPCPIIANFHILNDKFKLGIELDETDYIDIFKVNKKEEIKDFINNTTHHMCAYCRSKDRKIKKWDISSRTLEEYLFHQTCDN